MCGYDLLRLQRTGQKQQQKVVGQLRQKSGLSKLVLGIIKNEGIIFPAQINLCTRQRVYK